MKIHNPSAEDNTDQIRIDSVAGSFDILEDRDSTGRPVLKIHAQGFPLGIQPRTANAIWIFEIFPPSILDIANQPQHKRSKK